MVTGPDRSGAIGPGGGLLALLVELAGLALVVNAARRRTRTRRIGVGVAGVFVDGELAIPKEGIQGLSRNGRELRIRAGGFRSLVVRTTDEGDLDALVEALQLPAAAGTVTLRTSRQRDLVIALAVLYFVAPLLLRSGGVVVAAAYGIVLVTALVRFIRAPYDSVRLGTDGIGLGSVARWLGVRDRYLPYSSLALAPAGKRGVQVSAWGRRFASLDFSSPEGAHKFLIDVSRAQALAKRESPGELVSVPTVAHRLARNGKTTAEWVAALRALGRVHASDGDYRQPAITTEQLRQVMRDGLVEPGTRVAAAIALHGTMDSDEELRRVAVASANPRVERALMRVLSPSTDDEISDVLVEAEAESSTAFRRH